MSKKEDKIVRLYKEGLDIRLIARRLGYEGSAITAGIQKVKEVLQAHGIKV